MRVEQASAESKEIAATSEEVENSFFPVLLCCVKLQLRKEGLLTEVLENTKH